MGMSSSSRLNENRATFQQLLADATCQFDRGRPRSASALMQSAARFAWYNHPGFFRSDALEVLAARLSVELPSTDAIGDLRGHVVHVISQAYLAGGHTRLVWRWIENDPSRTHSVVLIGQQAVPVPQQLEVAVARSGGRVVDIGRDDSNLLLRASKLRRIAESEPAVMILHIHPYDIVPSIALPCTPASVIFATQADPVSSVALEDADLFADIRVAGQRLSIQRRSVVPAQSRLLPIPLAAPPAGDVVAARERLGLSATDVVVVSIATAYKYGAERGQHFVDVHLDFVLANPEVRLHVVGPDDEGRWSEANTATGGRFRAVGRVPDVADYYAAADIYVDSLPFASLTSLLDAAARGVSTVALAELAPGSVLTSDDVALVAPIVQFADRTEYLGELDRLVRDKHRREERGRALARNIANEHVSPGWNAHLSTVMAGAGHEATPTPVVLDPGQTEPETRSTLDTALVDFQVVSGLAEPMWQARLRDAPYLPFVDRWKLLRSLPGGRRLRASHYLLSDRTRSSLKRLFSRR